MGSQFSKEDPVFNYSLPLKNIPSVPGTQHLLIPEITFWPDVNTEKQLFSCFAPLNYNSLFQISRHLRTMCSIPGNPHGDGLGSKWSGYSSLKYMRLEAGKPSFEISKSQEIPLLTPTKLILEICKKLRHTQPGCTYKLHLPLQRDQTTVTKNNNNNNKNMAALCMAFDKNKLCIKK